MCSPSRSMNVTLMLRNADARSLRVARRGCARAAGARNSRRRPRGHTTSLPCCGGDTHLSPAAAAALLAAPLSAAAPLLWKPARALNSSAAATQCSGRRSADDSRSAREMQALSMERPRWRLATPPEQAAALKKGTRDMRLSKPRSNRSGATSEASAARERRSGTLTLCGTGTPAPLSHTPELLRRVRRLLLQVGDVVGRPAGRGGAVCVQH